MKNDFTTNIQGRISNAQKAKLEKIQKQEEKDSESATLRLLIDRWDLKK